VDTAEILVKLGTSLGLPGAMLWVAFRLGTPMVKVWAAREEVRTHALEVTVDGVRRILGELRALRGPDNHR